MSSKREDLTTAPFMAWLAQQPKDETYCYTANGHCLVAQYLKSRGWIAPSVGPYDACEGSPDAPDYDLPQVFQIAGAPDSFEKNRATFGAAHERAKAFLAA